VPDTGLTPHELDELDGALTGCALGIDQAGTIVLDGGPERLDFRDRELGEQLGIRAAGSAAFAW
jgi:hypothetical protein